MDRHFGSLGTHGEGWYFRTLDRFLAHAARRRAREVGRLRRLADRAAAPRHPPARPDVHVRPRPAAHHRERRPERYGGTGHESGGRTGGGRRPDRVAPGDRLVAPPESGNFQAAHGRGHHAHPRRQDPRGALPAGGGPPPRTPPATSPPTPRSALPPHASPS